MTKQSFYSEFHYQNVQKNLSPCAKPEFCDLISKRLKFVSCEFNDIEHWLFSEIIQALHWLLEKKYPLKF